MHSEGPSSHCPLSEEAQAYDTAIPDAVFKYYAAAVGLDPNAVDPTALRLIAIAAQKFIADIAVDVIEHKRMNEPNKYPLHQKGSDPERTLTSDYFEKVLAEYSIDVKKPVYYK